MLCYNTLAKLSRIRGFFVPVIAGHKARSIIRNQQGTPPRWLGLATTDDRPGLVLEANMAYCARRRTYKKHWNELVSMYGSLCFWCREEPATCIDHCIPYSWDQNNDIDNLVPSCMTCNALAGSKMFESVEHKRQYILNRRHSRNRRIMLRCSECLVPFVQHEHSPSPFLCAHCYDMEYGTSESSKKSWRMWLALLDQADIPYLAHFEARKKGTAKDRKQFAYSVISVIEQWEDEAYQNGDTTR